MPAKAPIYLKSGGGKNGPGNGKGGKKLRELLSAEMISPPLGDFRHMAHVGRGADDMFGDTTFLQQKLASDPNRTNAVDKVDGVSTLQHPKKKGSKKSRNHSVPDEHGLKGEVKSLSYDGYGPMESPILQTAFSLPLLNQQCSSSPASPTRGQQDKNKKSKKTMNNNCISNGKSRSHEVGLDTVPFASTPNGTPNGPPKPRRINIDEEATGNGHVGNGLLTDKQSDIRRSSEVISHKPELTSYTDTTSLDEGWALDLDMGTSLMDDVMGIMDKIEL